MKRKMTALRYLLGGILFLPAAYLLCGVTSLPFWAAVHFQNVRVLTITWIGGFVSASAIVAIVAPLLVDFMGEAFMSAGCLFGMLLLLLGMLLFVPALILGFVIIACVLGALLVLYEGISNPLPGFGILFAIIVLGSLPTFAGAWIMSRIDGEATNDRDSFAEILRLSTAFPLTLSGAMGLAYLVILCVPLKEGAELLTLINLAVVERLNAFAALAGLVIFAFLAWSDYHENLPDFCQYPADRKIIARLALNDKRGDVRKAAVELLPYPQEREILERIAQNDERWDVREAARKKIEAWEERTQGGADKTTQGGAETVEGGGA